MTTDWYQPPANPLPEGEEWKRINDLRTKYADGRGYLSNVVWNTRNAYLAYPLTKIDATTVRMIVEGFLVEIETIRGVLTDEQRIALGIPPSSDDETGD